MRPALTNAQVVTQSCRRRYVHHDSSLSV
jgi:hypothetical protein